MSAGFSREPDRLFFKYYSLQEEEFTGFGARRGRPPKASLRQTKTQRARDQTEGAKPLVGKILTKTAKSIGKIVQGAAKESPVKDKETPQGMIKLRSNRQKPAAKAERALDILTRTRLRGLTEKAATSEESGGAQSQTSVSLTGCSRRDKMATPLTDITDAGQTSKVEARGKPLSGGVSVEPSQPQRAAKRTRGFRFGAAKCASREVALTCTSIHKRQRRRLAKGMVASPEAGAEAGSQTGQEAAMPFQCTAKDSPEKRRRRRRKSLFGHRQKSLKHDSLISLPKLKRNRIKRVFYTYVVEPLPTAPTPDGASEQPRPSPNVNASASESSQENSSGSRSSRVIKVPKRFLDEEIIPFPKGSLSTWLKSQTKEEDKPSPSRPESTYADGCQPLESIHFIDTQSKGDVSPNLSSHVELYKNLKKLAEKKKGRPAGVGDHFFDSDGSTAHVKKRRKSKITMEETDAPGVVRKLSVVVNSNVEKPPGEPAADEDDDNKSKTYFLIDSSVKLQP